MLLALQVTDFPALTDDQVCTSPPPKQPVEKIVSMEGGMGVGVWMDPGLGAGMQVLAGCQRQPNEIGSLLSA